MPDFAEPLARLINEFKRLPGIGQKSAQRIAFHVMRASRDDAAQLGAAILDVKDKLRMCAVCNNISGRRALPVLPRSAARSDRGLRGGGSNNIVGIEVTRQFNGLYHVLGGALSPLRGIGPEQLASRAWWTASPRAASQKSSWRRIRPWKARRRRSIFRSC